MKVEGMEEVVSLRRFIVMGLDSNRGLQQR